MSITNYSELQTAVAAWINRTDLTALLPDFITLAESKLNRRLRTRYQETALTSQTITTYALAILTAYHPGRNGHCPEISTCLSGLAGF